MSASIQKDELTTYIYLRNCKEVFGKYKNHKEEIEQFLGCAVIWREAEKDCKIIVTIQGDIKSDGNRWNEFFTWYCDTALKLKEVIDKYE